MFKKITALLLLTAFTNVYALTPMEQSAARGAELGRTFDALNYSLNVEWDQKDAKFFDEAVASFTDDVAALQRQGMTQDEMMDYTMNKIKDSNVKNEITKLAKVIADSKMSNEEARAFTMAKMNSIYSNGTSWSGTIFGMRPVYFIGTVIVVAGIIHYYRCHRTTGSGCDFLPGFPDGTSH